MIGEMAILAVGTDALAGVINGRLPRVVPSRQMAEPRRAALHAQETLNEPHRLPAAAPGWLERRRARRVLRAPRGVLQCTANTSGRRSRPTIARA
jgi:hypothetical protein